MKLTLNIIALTLAVVFSVPNITQVAAQDSYNKQMFAKRVAHADIRAKAHTDVVAKELGLDDEKKQLVLSALQAKYRHNASTIRADMNQDQRAEVWRQGNAKQADLLASQFSKQEIRKISQIAKAANEAGRLFNGKDLDGWKQVNGTATYEVIDGAIVGTTVAGSPNSFLATEKNYANFELYFEVFLVDNELNSGVQFRSAMHTDETLAEIKKKHPVGRVFGYQCEIEASAEGDMDPEKFGDAGYIYDAARRGWLIDDETRLAAKTRGAFKNGQWNRMRIIAKGDHIQTFINGKKISDLHDDMTASGFIALQVHGIGKRDEKWQVKWRSINIKELP